MCKTELFSHILDVVAAETELSRDAIFSKNKSREIVDARYILVYYLTPQGVRQIAHTFKVRRKQSGKIFEITLQRVGNDPEINSLLSI